MTTIPFEKFQKKHELEINEIIDNELNNKHLLKYIDQIATETYNLTYDKNIDYNPREDELRITPCISDEQGCLWHSKLEFIFKESKEDYLKFNDPEDRTIALLIPKIIPDKFKDTYSCKNFAVYSTENVEEDLVKDLLNNFYETMKKYIK